MQSKIEAIIIKTLKNLADEFEYEGLENPNAQSAIYGGGDGTDGKNRDFGQIDILASVLEFAEKYL